MPDTRPLWQYFVYFIGAKSRYGRSYPLTPALLSLSHVDGTMLKTDKSKLYKVLESKTRCQIQVVDETVIDASFSLYLQLNLQSTFGGIAKCILSNIVDLPGNVIH